MQVGLIPPPPPPQTPLKTPGSTSTEISKHHPHFGRDSMLRLRELFLLHNFLRSMLCQCA